MMSACVADFGAFTSAYREKVGLAHQLYTHAHTHIYIYLSALTIIHIPPLFASS